MHKSTDTLTPDQVYRCTEDLIQSFVTIKPRGRVAVPTLWAILLYAASRVTSITDACGRLRDAPDEMTTFAALHAGLPESNRLQRQVQAALRGHLPSGLTKRPRTIAVDLTLIPEYGKPEGLPLYRGRDNRGTHWSWAYATSSVVCHGQRLTLGLLPVTRDVPTETILKRLLGQVRAAGVAIRTVLMDSSMRSKPKDMCPKTLRRHPPNAFGRYDWNHEFAHMIAPEGRRVRSRPECRRVDAAGPFEPPSMASSGACVDTAGRGRRGGGENVGEREIRDRFGLDRSIITGLG